MPAWKNFLENALDILSHPLYIIDAEHYSILLANRAARERGIVPGRRCYEATHNRTRPCNGPDLPCLLAMVRSSRKATIVEHRCRDRDGEVRCLEVHGKPVFDVNGTVTHVIEYAIDVTERRGVENALRESRSHHERLYKMVRLMADNLPDMLWAKDLEGRYLFANRALCEGLLMASDTEEPIGKTDLFFAERERAAHPDDPTWYTFGEVWVDSDTVVLERKAPGRFDESGNVRGRFLCLDVRKAPFFDDDGHIIGTVGSARDVTRERALEAERRLLQAAIDQADMGVIILDLEGTVLYANRSYGRITGFAPEEIVGRKVDRIFEHYRDPEVAEEIHRTVSSGRRWAGRVEKTRKDGTPYVQGQTIVPLRDEDGEIRTIVSYLQDVTPQVELQNRYLRAQKLETVGRMVGGIAHDFNNILAAIRAYAELLQMELEAGGASRGAVEEILAATETGARLTRQLLAFARRQPAAPRPFDLNAAVAELVGMLRRLVGAAITLTIELAPDLPHVLADPSQIEQVLVNLVVNARDAMPDGGRLAIVTRLGERPAGGGAPALPERWAVLEVRDTGVGMSEDVQQHIFEPFFTTKEPDRGTGLGLSTCFGIVTQAGGGIEVESRPGAGTTMRVFFPLAPDEAREDAPEEDQSLSAGAGTILLVDDEGTLRRALGKALRSLGYTVLEAGDGAQALGLWKDREGRIDLLVTDEVMPHMAGSELIRCLRIERPDLPVILVSGNPGGSVEAIGEPGERSVIIHKPFSVRSIGRAIRELLDGHGEGVAEE